MFQTRRTGEQSYNVKPFNVKTDYSAKTIADPIEVYDHLVVELNLSVECRVPPNRPVREAERISRRAIIDQLYGPILARLSELKRAVYYDDNELILEVIREAQEWIHDLEKN